MTSGGTRKRIRWSLWGAVALLPASGQAQSPCAVAADIVAAAPWQGPLDRPVTLRANDVTIGDALDRLAAATGIRFSYSADAVPLARHVCVSFETLPVGSALEQLLRGTDLEPVIAGPDHVVLAPVRGRAVANEPAEPVPAVVPLEVVRVHGRAGDAPDATAATHAVVIDGRQLAHRGSTTLAEVMNGVVPGVWMWHDGSGGGSAAYGSIRGASSFRGASAKVYIDGIEVANSQLLTRISPATIERIDIIRGPQGAALYGANALSGVVNIVTRRAYAEGGSPLQYLQTGVGVTSSDFAGRTTLSQDHAIGIVAGADGRSAGVNLSVGTFGEYAPGAAAQHIAADAFGRIVGSRSVVTATLRFLSERSGTASSPVLPDSLQSDGGRIAPPNAVLADLPSMRQYTAGISASFQPNSRWSHTTMLGLDGYRLAEPTALLYDRTPAPTELMLGALRMTARVNSLRQVTISDLASGTITLAAEHSLLRQEGLLQNVAVPLAVRRGAGAGAPRATAASPETPVDDVSSSTGLSAQSQLLLRERFLLTGGIRFERSGSPLFAGRWAALPMVGGAVLARYGPADIRLRTAFGRAIRWPAAPASAIWQGGHRPLLQVPQPPEE